MADSLTSATFAPLQQHVRYILSRLRTDLVFLILPKTELGAMNPRELPRELYAEDGIVFSEMEGAQKRKGRPARREKGKKARLALEGLDDWISSQHRTDEDPTEMATALDRYDEAKHEMLDAVGAESVEEAGREVLGHLEEARELVGATQSVGLQGNIFELCK